MKYFTLLFVCFFFFAGCSNKNTSKDSFNIVLITIDTLRADHLSCYGYERKTSPNIDKIAEKGTIFKNAIAPSSWTAPSMVSLFTSTYPINHGVIHNHIRKNKKYSQEVFSKKLTTLPEILKQEGYTTFGVSSNHTLNKEFGFARGFDYFKNLGWKSANRVNKIVYSWEDTIKKSNKFFLWVHYIDPHLPYYPRPPWSNQYTSHSLTQALKISKKSPQELNARISIFKENPQALSNLVALYDSEINYVDAYVGELIKKLDFDANTLFIITSDHGEQFLERGGIGHPFNLHKEVLHVPLIIKLPDRSKMESIEKHVSLLDIMPTILNIIDSNPPEQTIGKALLKNDGPLFWLKKMLLRRGSGNSFAELNKKSIFKAIITPKWKYIYNYKNETEQLYNIKSDSQELNNLADKESSLCNQLKKNLFNWVALAKKYPTKSQILQFSQKEKERLGALGYLATEDNMDYDKDGMPNDQDNCPNVPNQDQEDTDGNGIGNKCEPSLLEYYWLEAENADTIVEPLEVAKDANSSEGRFIYSPNGKKNQYVPSAIMATYKVSISQAGDYILLGRVKVIDKRDNSFFVQIDDGPNNLWEIEAGNYWHWDVVNNRDDADPVKFSLTEGVHTIRIKLREDGTKLDKMLLTNDLTFVPSGKDGIT